MLYNSGMANEPEESSLVRMSFGEHIEELRKRLILAILGVVLAGALTFWYGRDLISFIYGPLVVVLDVAGLPKQTYTDSSVPGFTIYMKVSLIAALVLASPWVVYQAWRFVESGLYAAERKAATFLMGMSAIMTLIGVMFTYYIFLPATMVFLVFWTITYPPPESSSTGALRAITQRLVDLNDSTFFPSLDTPHTRPAPTTGPAMTVPLLEKDPEKPLPGQVWFNQTQNEMRFWDGAKIRVMMATPPTLMVPLISPEKYLNEALMITIVNVIVFHVPVVLAIIGITGLIDPAVLRKRRRWVIFGCFVLAVFLTPSQDIFTNIALPMLMWGLFELGLVLMAYFYNRHQRALEEPEE